MFDQMIKFVASEIVLDEYGDQKRKTTERIVWAELKSISQNEFYQAHAIGMKPELKFKLADYLEYRNEKHLKYKEFGELEEQTYTVIRTHRTGNELEIICKRGAE